MPGDRATVNEVQDFLIIFSPPVSDSLQKRT